MGHYRNYSDDEKAQAIAFLTAHRGNYRVASKTLGIPWQTLRNWYLGDNVSPPVIEKGTQKMGDLADALEEKIWLMVGEGFQPDKIREAPVNALSTAIGTFVDKVRLLRNEPTEIHGDDGNDKRVIIEYANRTAPADAPDAAPETEGSP